MVWVPEFVRPGVKSGSPLSNGFVSWGFHGLGANYLYA